MTYVRIEDDMHENRKVRSVSPAARWSYIASICRSGNKRTDGLLATFDLSQVDGDRKIAKELEGAGLWEPRPGGWYVHDYLLHNRSNAQIAAAVETARQNGRRGLAKRYANLSSNPLAETGEKPSNPLSSFATQIARSVSSGIPSKDQIPENDPEIQSISSNPPSKPLARKHDLSVDDEAWIDETQAKHPTVNVREIIARKKNRDTWAGYKDHRAAVVVAIGFEEKKATGGTNGRTAQAGRYSPHSSDGVAESWLRVAAERDATPGRVGPNPEGSTARP